MTLSAEDRRAFEEFERSGWERAAAAYDRHWGGLSIQSARPMLEAAGVGPGTRVLDVATGAGYVAGLANQMGATAVGIDFSGAQVELARRKYPDADFLRASAEALPFEPDAFHAVVAGFGLNHLPEPEALFREALRVLKPGGWFAFTVWAVPGAGQGFGIVLSAIEELGSPTVRLPPAPPYFRFADPDEARRVFAATGVR